MSSLKFMTGLLKLNQNNSAGPKLSDLTSRSKHRSNNIFALSPKSKNKNSTSKLTPNSHNSTNSPKSSNKSKSKQKHVQQNLPVFRASTFKNQALKNKLYQIQ